MFVSRRVVTAASACLVLAVASLFFYCGTSADMSKVAKALVRILKSSREAQARSHNVSGS